MVDDRIDQLCASWEMAGSVADVDDVVPCRSAIVLPGALDGTPRFCFVSVGSPLEAVLGLGSGVQVRDRAGSLLGLGDLTERLLGNEVAVVLAPTSPKEHSPREPVDLPTALLERRQHIRQDNVAMRFLLRQIGLDEVTSHRGAAGLLFERAADRWSLDLALCNDPAMLLCLGADRQRYVDAHFTERATDRLPRALGRLHDLGVRAYPRLVVV